MSRRNNDQPSDAAIAAMLRRMHNDAAADESREGRHASSARHEQLAAEYRDAGREGGSR